MNREEMFKKYNEGWAISHPIIENLPCAGREKGFFYKGLREDYTPYAIIMCDEDKLTCDCAPEIFYHYYFIEMIMNHNEGYYVVGDKPYNKHDFGYLERL